MIQHKGGSGDANQSRKAQIKLRRELNAKEREKKKRMKEFDQLKDKTATVYNEIIEEMKDEIWNGYLTSSDEEQSEEDEDEQEAEEEEEIHTEDEEEDEEAKEYIKLEDSIKPRWYILSARSSIKFRWDVIIIFFAVINALTLPMEIAFETYLEEIE